MKKYILIIILQIVSAVSFSQFKVNQLLCENRIDPFGIDNTQPEFNWQLVSDKRNVLQNACLYSCKRLGSIKESGKNLSQRNGLKVTGKEGDYLIVEVGSGIYHFAALK